MNENHKVAVHALNPVGLISKAIAPVLSGFGFIKSENLGSLKKWKPQAMIAVSMLAILAILMILFGSRIYEILKNFVKLIFT